MCNSDNCDDAEVNDVKQWAWSDCSKNYLDKWLKSGDGKCLWDELHMKTGKRRLSVSFIYHYLAPTVDYI